MISIRGFALAAMLLPVSLAVPAQAENSHEVYQTSVVSTLWDGDFQGQVSVGELKRHGNFGVGAVDQLDGELVGLNGDFFQVQADGSVHKLPDQATVPFAVVIPFKPTATIEQEAVEDFAALGRAIDQRLERLDTVVPIRVHAHFSYLKVRSVPRQSPPFKPLAEVLKTQPVFEFKDVTGTLVGFRAPETMKGVNAVGYHMHFISDDQTKGGHVLNMKMDAATVEVDYADKVVLQMPVHRLPQVTDSGIVSDVR